MQKGHVVVRPSNDKIERHYFKQFSKLFPLPDGDVAYRDKPDVIIHGTRKVGIEMTNFFVQSGIRPESEQRQRPLREKTIAEAHKLYLAGGGKNIELTFGFDKATPIVPARMKALSKDLAAFARSTDGNGSGEIYRHLSRDTMLEIWSIYLNAKEYADTRWQIIQVHTVELMSQDDLEAIVKEKESVTAHPQFN